METMTDTPETDAVNTQGVGYAQRFYAMKAHARKLEKERNQLKALLAKGHGAVTISRNGYIEELESKLQEHKLALESADAHNHQLACLLETAREQLNGR